MKTLTLIFALVISVSLFAENTKNAKLQNSNHSISGKIVDEVTGENLAGVRVQLVDSEVTVFTDFDGNFELNLPSNIEVAHFRVSLISYETQTINFDQLNNQSSIRITPVAR